MGTLATSNFFLVTKVIGMYNNTKEKHLIDLIFPESEIKEHLTYKLETCIEKSHYEQGLVWFYENLDVPHRDQFDAWFNAEVEDLKESYKR